MCSRRLRMMQQDIVALFSLGIQLLRDSCQLRLTNREVILFTLLWLRHRRLAVCSLVKVVLLKVVLPLEDKTLIAV